ncbi:hypothetical protein [Runella sp.]|uniref:hypothetical protein n=1 Tax=Runella sp. TaxID=1960881 RepID=UPI003D0EC07B
MTDRELIQTSLFEISSKLGYADVRSLKQRDLEFISAEIEKKTTVLISLSTLKRLFNGQFSKLPQTATLNAITAYLGYENWQDFKVKKREEIPVNETPHHVSKPQKRQFSFSIIGIGSAIIFLISVAVFIYKISQKATPPVVFTIKKTTPDAIPNTVVFTYDVSQVEADSFFIQQSWDKRKRVKIDRNSHTLTDIYYEPGYHTAKLIANDKIIKTIGVSIPTKGWFFYAKKTLFQEIPSYLQFEQPTKTGVMGLTLEGLLKNDINPASERYYNYAFISNPLSFPADNFRFTTKVRVKNIQKNACPIVMCEVYCQHHFLFFSSTPPGCAHTLNAQFGETILRGQTNDLSALGSDVEQWQLFEMLVKNKIATVVINGKKVLSAPFKETTGNITGMGFISNGLCEVDFVKLETLNGEVVYADDFTN